MMTSIVGFVGLILYLVGWLNRNKKWSHVFMNLGAIIMAISILIDCFLGFYDGFVGNPAR